MPRFYLSLAEDGLVYLCDREKEGEAGEFKLLGDIDVPRTEDEIPDELADEFEALKDRWADTIELADWHDDLRQDYYASLGI